jgi:hypothetical protein
MPVVDDEYPQLVAALNAALASDGSTFVAIELGAWSALLLYPNLQCSRGGWGDSYRQPGGWGEGQETRTVE